MRMALIVAGFTAVFTFNYYYTERQRQFCLKVMQKELEAKMDAIVQIDWEDENSSWTKADAEYGGVVKVDGQVITRIKAKTDGITYSFTTDK